MLTSCDTKILLHASNARSPRHVDAAAFLGDMSAREDFVVCELILIELYVLIRNPAVVSNPLGADDAAAVCRRFRSNPRWRVVDYPGGFMDEIWRRAGLPGATLRSIFDTRLALTLKHHGVTDFATGNVKHFDGFGFARVWDPLAPSGS
jgi:toxin-antitoxin system PIN domain toxin